jgi:hypothetical protein
VLGALPGIREIRSALAGGYIWIAFFWLALDPSLGKSDFREEPFQSAHHLGNDVGPVALGITLTFAAYLIGTFFNEARGLLARVYLAARRSASGESSAERRTAVIENARRQRHDRREERRRSRLERLGKHSPEVHPTSQERPSRGALAAFLVGFNKGLIEAAEIASRGVGALIYSSNIMAEGLVVGVEDFQEGMLVVVRRLSSIRIEPYKPFVSKEGAAAIERYVERKKAGIRFGKAKEAPGPTVADVIADFPIVRTRLIHKSPDTVSEYDRLRAEADFRSAIVPPLFAIIVLFALEVSWHWALMTGLLLILLITARQKRREAGDILADTLGIVDAPCVETAHGD